MHTVHAPLVEHIAIPDVFSSGIHDVEDVGDGHFRLVFFVKQRCAYDDGNGEERAVVARLVLSKNSIFLLARVMLKALGVKCCGAAGRAGLIH